MSCLQVRPDTNEGQAVTIVEVEDKNLKVNFEALAKILKNDNIKDLPVGIVSVAGDFRTGKSFLLNLFLRHLDKKTHTHETVETNQEWNVDDGIGCRFDWKTTAELVTRGIQMWSEPYIVEIEGKKVAILLVDTQGNFDLEVEGVVNYKIFALSTLISSVQLYNVSRQLQRDTFEHLQGFMTFAESYNSGEKSSFQELTFLVRDWQEHRGQHYGFEGGDKYLDEKCMKQLQRYRDAEGRVLHDVFKAVRCFLLPHPGMAVLECRDSKDLNFKGIKKDFMAYVEYLANEIFSSSGIIKQFVVDEQTEVVTGEKLYRFLGMIANDVNGDKLPVVQTTLEFMIQNECEKTLKATIHLFKDRTQEISESLEKGHFTFWEDFNRVIEEAEEESLKEFDQAFGSGSGTHTEYREKTKDELQTIKTTLNEGNREKEGIKKECEKRKTGATATFRSITSQITDLVDDGRFAGWDDFDKAFENANLKAKDYFYQGYGSGSVIHCTFLKTLNAELENETAKYKHKNSENKRNIDECKKLKKEAITMFETGVSKIVKKMEDGYFVETDDDTLVNAKLEALKHFGQASWAGSTIQKMFEVDLTAKLNEIINRHNRKNDANKGVAEDCEKRMNKAITKFNKHLERATKRLREGYSVENDIFKTAKLKAMEVFLQDYENGCVIHQRYKEKITTQLETDVECYKRQNNENKCIIQECEERSNDSKKRFTTYIKDLRRKLDDGEFEEIQAHGTLENAKVIAMKHFKHSPEVGSVIHQRIRRKLSEELETDITELTLENRENTKKYHERKRQYDELERTHLRRVEEVDGWYWYEKDLQKQHDDIIEKLPLNDSDSKALKKLRNEMIANMDKQRVNRKKKISSNNKTTAIKGVTTVVGAAAVIGGGAVAIVSEIIVGAALGVFGVGTTALGLYGLSTQKRD